MNNSVCNNKDVLYFSFYCPQISSSILVCPIEMKSPCCVLCFLWNAINCSAVSKVNYNLLYELLSSQ